MLEKERSPGGYNSDSETSSTGRYLSVYIRNNGNGSGIDDRKKVCGEKTGGYTSDSEASTEANVIDSPKKVCRRKRERS